MKIVVCEIDIMRRVSSASTITVESDMFASCSPLGHEFKQTGNIATFQQYPNIGGDPLKQKIDI
jgi:hypothetical protein